jgi:hypothetical protein
MTPSEWRQRIEALEAAAKKAVAEPMLVYIKNDPERRHGGPDESKIGGQVYLCGDDEDRGAFETRLRIAAAAAGAKMVCISVEDFGPGPFLDDVRIGDLDPTKTIEIGEMEQP